MSESPTRCHLLLDHTVDRRPAAAPGEIRAFATCRNERLRLPAFLRHYRNLGVDRFFIVDNDSSDGTTDYLVGQADVHLFRTANRYSAAHMGTDWLNALLGEFGVGSSIRGARTSRSAR
jgi:Glycosyl transferase family 2